MLQVSAALLRAMQLCARSDYAEMQAFLIKHAEFVYDWLSHMETRGGGNNPGPLPQVDAAHVQSAFENMTVLYESRIQTIPLSLLTIKELGSSTSQKTQTS